MKKIAYLTLSAIALLAFATLQSCEKENQPFVNETPVTPSNPTTTEVKGGDYQPIKKGSTWEYKGASSYTVTMGIDTVIAATNWTIATNSVSGKAFFRKENGNYYQLAKDPQGVNFTLLYLKDTVDKGTSWNNDIIVNGLRTRYQYTLVAYGLNKIVGNTTYPNVIQVHSNVSVDYANNGVYTPYATGDYFYAKDIGFIYSSLQGSETVISSYFIK